MTNKINKELRLLKLYNIILIISTIVLFIYPFCLYIVNEKIEIDLLFIGITILNIFFIIALTIISKKIKFKTIQIHHFKKKEKN